MTSLDADLCVALWGELVTASLDGDLRMMNYSTRLCT